MRKNVMLARKFNAKALKKFAVPWLVQPKINGRRCLAFCDASSVTLVSSEGNVIVGVPHINAAITKIIPNLERLPYFPIVLDGELFSFRLTFEELSSIASRTKNVHPDHSLVEYWIFDFVSSTSNHARSYWLRDLQLFPPLRFVNSTRCVTQSDLNDTYKMYVEAGFEGIIIRDPDLPYMPMKRAMMKMKPLFTMLAKVVGYKQEISVTGEPKDALGAFRLRDERGVEFSVGTGFTRAEREYFWDYRNAMLGKTVELAYAGRSEYDIPFFTRFIRLI